MMTITKTLAGTLAVVAALAVFAPDASAKKCNYSNMAAGVSAAQSSGNQVKFICIGGHQFHLQFSVVNGQPQGWISHAKRWNYDDQIYFKGTNFKINYGGWCKVAGLFGYSCRGRMPRMNGWVPAMVSMLNHIQSRYGGQGGGSRQRRPQHYSPNKI